jgi:hypothetical protein
MISNPNKAQHSTGPRTPEGKAVSWCNALKHGLTGAGIALQDEDTAELERRVVSFHAELQPSGEVGEVLVRRAAFLSVRLDRCMFEETARLRERIRQAEVDFVVPEGTDAETLAQLRAEARDRAMFDSSKEGSLARRYEASAERGFFRALKELRLIEKQKQKPAKTVESGVGSEALEETLASFLQLKSQLEEFEARYPESIAKDARNGSRSVEPVGFEPLGGRVDVPINIGRHR